MSASPATPQRTLFDTFGGVFTPSILTILGAIMFLRANFVVGHAGILGALAILLLAKAVTLLSSLSVSAISTNMQVRGGGAYFMISRVLGPEFGGAIGTALFLAQALSVPFYILAFATALTGTFPALAPLALPVMLLTAAALFLVSYVGAGWAIKAQYFIMTVLLLAIVVFLAGGLQRFDMTTFNENLPVATGENALPFWAVFAIYFPAVTGILAGINMSGDLADPVKSIPKGTLLAVGAGFLVYLAQILVSGGAYARADLIEKPYRLLEESAIFGTGFLVAAGVIAATLSSALGSYLGAPRILQAVARDRILPYIGFFGRGAPQSDEPRRALILTGLITAAVLVLANLAGESALNIVASVLTMFFLYTYGMINLAAFTEAFGDNPSFRPRFRLFHWSTALLGTLACLGVALLINQAAALVAIVLIAALYWYITRKRLQATFGDARRGYVYAGVRRGLLRLAAMEEDSKNWRPTVLVFSGNPTAREALVTYAVWLEGGRGIVYLANILVGAIDEHAQRRRTAKKQLVDFCREKGIQAFPMVGIAKSLEEGVAMMLQTASVGPIRPNLAVFGFANDRAQLPHFGRLLRIGQLMHMGLVLLKARKTPEPRTRKRIDIWWRGQKNGALMVLLAHLLKQNWEWNRAEVRLLRLVQKEAGRQPARAALENLLQSARIEGEAVVVVSERPFPQILADHSKAASCVFLGFELPDPEREEAWNDGIYAMLEGVETAILVNSAGREDIFA